MLDRRITPATSSYIAGTLTIDYTANGTTPESVTITNDGTNVQLLGDVTGTTTKAIIGVNKIVVQSSGTSTNQSFTFDSSSSDPYSLSGGFTATDIDTIVFDMAVTATGSGVISVTAPKSIIINDVLASVSSSITLKANTQVTPSTGNFVGLAVNSDIQSTNGSIMLEGRGGDDTAGNQFGVSLALGAVVGATTTGAVSVSGFGGASSASANYGVALADASTITSGGGQVSVTGTGGGTGGGQTNFGVYVDGIITAGGSGSVTVNGTGGATTGTDNYGIYVVSTGEIKSSGGAVAITGKGGGVGASSNNHGVACDGPISAPGSGTVTIYGTGGVTTGVNNNGAYISGAVSTASGNISITGIGGGSGATASNFGVYLFPTTISAGDAGKVLIHGTGGATAGIAEIGVLVDGTTITTNSGTLTVTGIQGNAAAEGVLIDNSAVITSGGAADLTVNSTGYLNLSWGTLTAGKNMNLNSSAAITQFPVGNVIAATGTLTVNNPGQVAKFLNTGNQAAQLVIPAGVTAYVNGSFDATGSVQVSGKLGGTGSVGTVSVIGAGEIIPGMSPGKVTTGKIVFNPGTSLNLEINGSNAITEYDQLVVLGTVDLGNATLTGTVGFYVPPVGQKFTIINNDGTGDAVTGTFAGVIEGGTVAIGGYTFAVSYKGGDGNDVVMTRTAAATPPTASVIFGDGSNQRSMVKQLVVTFSEAVTFSGNVVDAFTLFRSGSGSPTGNVALTANPATGPASSVTITFSGSLTTNASLNDGFYDFTIDADQVTGIGGKLNGGADYAVIGTTTNKYFRLFGDADGSGVTDLGDYAAFYNAFNVGANTVFDYGEGDNNVGLADFAQFRGRFNLSP